MSKLDDIPADTTIEMTLDLERAFKAVDCIPTCHNCGKGLVIGESFKLAYVKRPQFYAGWTLKKAMKKAEPEDEMLCDECTADDLLQSRIAIWESNAKDYEDRVFRRGYYRGYTRLHIEKNSAV